MLGDLVVGTKVLDLFAGSGSLGLESLSRGASRDLRRSKPQCLLNHHGEHQKGTAHRGIDGEASAD